MLHRGGASTYLSASQTSLTFGTFTFNIHLIAAVGPCDVSKPNTEVGELKGDISGSSVLTDVIVESGYGISWDLRGEE